MPKGAPLPPGGHQEYFQILFQIHICHGHKIFLFISFFFLFCFEETNINVQTNQLEMSDSLFNLPETVSS